MPDTSQLRLSPAICTPPERAPLPVSADLLRCETNQALSQRFGLWLAVRASNLTHLVAAFPRFSYSVHTGGGMPGLNLHQYWRRPVATCTGVPKAIPFERLDPPVPVANSGTISLFLALSFLISCALVLRALVLSRT